MKKEEATITALSNQQGSVPFLICNLSGSNQLTHTLPTTVLGTPRALQDPQVPAGAHPCGPPAPEGHRSLKLRTSAALPGNGSGAGIPLWLEQPVLRC